MVESLLQPALKQTCLCRKSLEQVALDLVKLGQLRPSQLATISVKIGINAAHFIFEEALALVNRQMPRVRTGDERRQLWVYWQEMISRGRLNFFLYRSTSCR